MNGAELDYQDGMVANGWMNEEDAAAARQALTDIMEVCEDYVLFSGAARSKLAAAYMVAKVALEEIR